VLAAAVAARFISAPGLWLDEVLTVNIARMAPSDIPGALRSDGAPPLYYWMLHGWMRVFGTGDLAVRSLSGVFGVVALPLMWLAGRRLDRRRAPGMSVGGNRQAWISVLVLATCPFAVRYSTESRMYALVIVLVLAGLLALLATLDKPTPWRMAGLGACTAALLLTHYWALYLLAAVAALLALAALGRLPTVAAKQRPPEEPEPATSPRRRWPAFDPQPSKRALLAMALGALAFVPWLPTFWFQLRHTGTPWAAPARLGVLLDTIIDFAGGYWDPGLGLGLLYLSLLALGLWGRSLDRGRIELNLRGHPPGTALAAVCAATMALAVLAALVTGSAFAVRYTSVILPLTLLLAGVGVSSLVWPQPQGTVTAAVAILGLAAMVPNLTTPRTSAVAVAASLNRQTNPGDVVAYCPDQLGPAVSRLFLREAVAQVTFPRATEPSSVDWVDYREAVTQADPRRFATMLLDRAGPDGHIWVVWAAGYRPFGSRCSVLLNALREARPGSRTVGTPIRRTFEHPRLVHFTPQRPDERVSALADT